MTDQNDERIAAIQDRLFSLARSVIKFGGAALATHGYFSANVEMAGVGVVLGLLGLLFSDLTFRKPPSE
jgi:hypothetical protein